MAGKCISCVHADADGKPEDFALVDVPAPYSRLVSKTDARASCCLCAFARTNAVSTRRSGCPIRGRPPSSRRLCWLICAWRDRQFECLTRGPRDNMSRDVQSADLIKPVSIALVGQIPDEGEVSCLNHIMLKVRRQCEQAFL